MASVKGHHDNLFAPYYLWICGGFELWSTKKSVMESIFQTTKKEN
jgi:hypothetical protein